MIIGVVDNVEVEITPNADAPSDSAFDAVITDHSRSRAWSGTGATAGRATTEAVRRFLGDRRSSEYVKK